MNKFYVIINKPNYIFYMEDGTQIETDENGERVKPVDKIK